MGEYPRHRGPQGHYIKKIALSNLVGRSSIFGRTKRSPNTSEIGRMSCGRRGRAVSSIYAIKAILFYCWTRRKAHFKPGKSMGPQRSGYGSTSSTRETSMLPKHTPEQLQSSMYVLTNNQSYARVRCRPSRIACLVLLISEVLQDPSAQPLRDVKSYYHVAPCQL